MKQQLPGDAFLSAAVARQQLLTFADFNTRLSPRQGHKSLCGLAANPGRRL
jgi:hypothetical protein